MRKYEKRTQTTTSNYLAETVCDLCGKVAKHGNWETTGWDMNETEVEVKIRQKDGKQYPDGGWGTKIVVDLCPICFKNKLIPWLESEGAEIEEQEWDL